MQVKVILIAGKILCRGTRCGTDAIGNGSRVELQVSRREYFELDGK